MQVVPGKDGVGVLPRKCPEKRLVVLHVKVPNELQLYCVSQKNAHLNTHKHSFK